MVGSGIANVIAKRVIDEIIMFSRETETLKYMKVFSLQEIDEARHFIRVQHEEAQSARSSLAQVRAMVAEMEAMNDQDEYYDNLSERGDQHSRITPEDHGCCNQL
ncbi:hypothetical protein Tco_0072320 [Tanacetum coccineum]